MDAADAPYGLVSKMIGTGLAEKQRSCSVYRRYFML
jgi:hypothetical protein